MYQPEPISLVHDIGALLRYLLSQLQLIANDLEIGAARQVETLYAAPAKPREGMLAIADGTEWDPGAGQGVYCYYGAAWHKLG